MTLRPLFALPALLFIGATAPASGTGPFTDLGMLEGLAREHARTSAELAGARPLSVTVTRIDQRLQLPACDVPEAFIPDGRSVEGRTMIGVRCLRPVSWRIYVPVEVRVAEGGSRDSARVAPAPAAPSSGSDARAGAAARTPRASEPASGPDPGHSRGVARSTGPESPRPTQVVSGGQNVQVEIKGRGFAVRSEGTALGSAVPGQSVRVRMPSGQVVSGLAVRPGVVELSL